jgi:hypothetical protein
VDDDADLILNKPKKVSLNKEAFHEKVSGMKAMQVKTYVTSVMLSPLNIMCEALF